ncbi:MAG: metallopeptidase TldD-related protein [Candidatus Kapaibacterium sp.]
MFSIRYTLASLSISALAVLSVTATGRVYATDADPVLLRAMKTEMTRSMRELRAQEQPPYFLSYCITETSSRSMSAAFGKLESHLANKQRLLDLDLRVGDYGFDNTHIIRGQSFDMGGGRGAVPVPLMDDETAIRQCLWSATDRSFKAAVERYGKAKTNKAVKVKEEDLSADFSKETPVVHRDAARELVVDTARWNSILRNVSSRFSTDSRIYGARVYFQSDVNVKYYVNSEGSEIVSCEPIVKLFITASTKADDGMTLPLYRSYTAFTDDRLPSEQALIADADEMVALLGRLREAPLAETYTGPAILSGRSAGVFFHEIFGHRVEGHRQKDPNSAQTFKSFINKKILPPFIDVVFDPTKKQRGETDLVGYFEFDDEGVPARKVTCVKDGIFTSFLMSRSPIEGFASSNGHGRRQAGYRVVSRQSNLMVEAHERIGADSLVRALRTECKKQNKEYGLLFEDISGGFTFTGRTVPNAFNVQPLVVYKIYADGRPDELVRGVDLIGTPLATFNNIIAAADDCGIFNGVCGAESGGVPVSASSPSLLVSTIEVQKKSKSQAKPPILSAPEFPSAKP